MVLRKSRWLMLLTMNNLQADVVVQQVHGVTLSPDSELFQETVSDICKNIKSWKYKTVEAMIVIVSI